MKHLLLLGLCLLTSYAYAQQPTLSGRITDKNNTSIPFTNVFLKNTSYGTTTDKTGRFRLTSVPGTYTLVISSVGYATYTHRGT